MIAVDAVGPLNAGRLLSRNLDDGVILGRKRLRTSADIDVLLFRSVKVLLSLLQSSVSCLFQTEQFRWRGNRQTFGPGLPFRRVLLICAGTGNGLVDGHFVAEYQLAISKKGTLISKDKWLFPDSRTAPYFLHFVTPFEKDNKFQSCSHSHNSLSKSEINFFFPSSS